MDLRKRRQQVLNRDNYTCQCCGNRGKDKRLEAHHIIYKSRGGSNDMRNLITLCHKCHRKVHNGQIDI